MKESYFLDYLACILFRVSGAIFGFLPVEVSFFLGRRLGDCFYYFDLRHKARSYANIKKALGETLSPKEIMKITKDFYRSFGQSIIEIFLIMKVDRSYMDKYVSIEGLENIQAALKKGKGVVLTSVHAGSWELANIICANLGFPFVILIREQSWPRLNQLLNSYRRKKGCRIIAKEGGLKHLISELKNNSAIGITLDQGGKSGTLVEFFGKSASMSTGGIKLALKYNTGVVPVFFTRMRGPKIKIFVDKEIELSSTGDPENDVKIALSKIVPVFEGYIRKYPKEYLWTYKIWKYSDERDILILSDGKAGHLSQSQAVGAIAQARLRERGIRSTVNIVEAGFKNRFSKTALSLSSCLAGKYSCLGCLWCLKNFLQRDSYESLIHSRPDIIISCGSRLAAINFLISRQNLSKSIVVMRPSFLGVKRFDLVIMPRHDRPPKNKSVVVTEGALNLIGQEYLAEQSLKLSQGCNLDPQGPYIGVLIGGDSKKFTLDMQLISRLINEIKSSAKETNAGILLTTSRRTSAVAAELIKRELKSYPATKLMVIANEKNIPGVVAGILGLSRVVVSSPESISMISEAANSAKPVIVFKAAGLSVKHQTFLEHFAGKNYIYLKPVEDISQTIIDIWRSNPAVQALEDNRLVGEALGKIIL